MDETEEGDWDDRRLLKEREVDLKERNFAFEQKVVEFHRWLDTLPKKLSDNSKKTYVAAICSFFAFHRLDLKLTKSQTNFLYKRARPVRKYYNFTLEDIRKMSEVANPKERYVLLVGKSLGLRASDFIRLRQGTIIAHLDEKPPVSLGELYTKKEGVRASPFLDDDAVEASKIWLQVLQSKDKRNPKAKMLDITEQELTLIVRKLARRGGVNTGNESVRFHQLRVFLVTRLSKVMETNRWKQIVGKQVPESAYVKPFLLRDDYAKVTEFTTIREKVARIEVEELREEVKGLRKTLKRKEDLARSEVSTIKEKMRMLEKQFDDLKDVVRKLEWKQYYTLQEAFGEKVTESEEAERALKRVGTNVEIESAENK